MCDKVKNKGLGQYNITDQPESNILPSQKLEFNCPMYLIQNFTAEAGMKQIPI